MLRVQSPFQSSSIDPGLFADDPEQRGVVQSMSGPISLKGLHSAYEQALASNPERASTLEAMITRAEGSNAGQPAQRATPAWLGPALEVSGESKSEQLRAEITAGLKQHMTGQEDAIEQVVTVIMGLATGSSKKPRGVGLAGPAGVGKNELVRAIAKVLWGDENAVMRINGQDYLEEHQLNGALGGTVNYAGTKTPMDAEDSPLCPAAFDATYAGLTPQIEFRNGTPPILFVDEADKFGSSGGQSGARGKFFNKLLAPLADAEPFRFNNNEQLDMNGFLIIFASNDGADTVGERDGESARAHFRSALKSALSGPLFNRLTGVVGMDKLTRDDLLEIGGRKLDKQIAKLEAELREARIEVDIQLDPNVIEFLCDLSVDGSARKLDLVLENLVAPRLDLLRDQAQSEEVWQISFNKDDVAHLDALKREFAAAERLPPSVAPADMPLQVSCIKRKARFHAYPQSIPSAPDAAMHIWDSGTVGGRGFVLHHRGSFDTGNELSILQPGATPALDTYRQIEMPPELRDAHFVSATQVSDDELFVYGVTADEKRLSAQSNASVYNTNTKEWTEVEAPPPLLGAGIAGHDNKVLIVGGRHLEYSETDGWSVEAAEHVGDNPDNGKLVENAAFLLDLKGDEPWKMLDETPQSARLGIAAASSNGKAVLMGGDELVRVPGTGVLISRTSRDVDVFDFETETFSVGTDLPTPTSHARGMVDRDGLIGVMGGSELTEDGNRYSSKDTFMRMKEDGWTKENLPKEAGNLAAIPHTLGLVVGPFFEEGAPTEPHFSFFG